ncbi:MAG: ATP-dependent DNA helicase RecG [Clostridia bacterium]|nr:ATP-dependent DNA helicase RecG [Clostridia bacterium]
MSFYDTDIKFVKGIGEKRAQLFKKRLGLFTLQDLISHYPRAYEDWSNPTRIDEIPFNENVCIKAKISSDIQKKITRNKKIETYQFYIYDRTGQIRVTIFNNKYLAESLKREEEYLFYGKVKWSGIFREMSSPEIRSVTECKIRPIYPSTEGLTSRQIEKIMVGVFEKFEVSEYLPDSIVKQFNLMSHPDAVKQVHFPETKEKIQKARNRLAFEELLLLRLGLTGLKNRSRGKNSKKIIPLSSNEIASLFPFELTNAQNRVIKECLSDMNGEHPMNRLVQGDVGCGKTAVAAALCYATAKNGYASVMLAPTEILANQHFKALSSLFEPFRFKIELLTGSLTQKEKNRIKSDFKKGKIDILVSTHAVLTDDVELPNTALVITDEQHRFGVAQRAILSQKANHPHTLVMSATPIPRTMGLVIYGDLDISIIDELPKGRTPIKSYCVNYNLRNRAIGYVKKHIDDGFQGYIVCPMIDNDSETDLTAATDYAEELRNGLLKGYNIGLLHGKMKPKEKDKIMADFALGKIQVLVSTTVIEVGIDVPNAVIMVVENADRFGLSQLHQLRGRVGRGSAESSCIFISNSTSKTTNERLKTLCTTTDGFKIAEADLKLRGPGNFLGKEQHGLPQMKIADLIEDREILYASTKAAEFILAEDLTLSLPQNKELKDRVNSLFSKNRKIEFN